MNKRLTVISLLYMLLVAGFTASAQGTYTISGTVKTEKGEPLSGATVFIGGSERIMPTGEAGRFAFHNLPAGVFQLSVQMLGYTSLTQNVIVKNRTVEIDLQLQPKAINLQQVTIGKKKASLKNLKLFEEKFLGLSANGKQCVILNPGIINFSTKKGLLMADADEFLIIENKRLGYRIRYMLSGFYYNNITKVVNYHGECSFEELAGTDDQKKGWATNRLDTYRGSFTHFLRSVYANNTVKNGFVTRSSSGYVLFKYDTTTIDLADYVVAKDRQVLFDSLVTPIDTDFAAFKFKRQLYIDYNPRMALHYRPDRFRFERSFKVEDRASILHLMTDRAIIDKRGGYADYRDFLMDGYWAKARVGDQLPVEYQPPLKN